LHAREHLRIRHDQVEKTGIDGGRRGCGGQQQSAEET
jgi:hypothetical protein